MRTPALFDLTGKSIVVTGGAGLLGSSFCRAIAEAGGFPIAWDIDEPALLRLSQSMAADQLQIAVKAVDLTQEKQITAAAAELTRDKVTIWGLVNNVAIDPKMNKGDSLGNLETYSLDSWNSGLMLNVTTAFLCARELGNLMNQSGGGSIINIASDLAFISPDHRIYNQDDTLDTRQTKPVVYSVSKSALIGLTRYLATYWSPVPVRSNALVPGAVFNNQSDSLLSELTARIPMARLGSPDELRGPLVFLLSEASSYMTGSFVFVDGGRTAW